jgi:hypothetical protein
MHQAYIMVGAPDVEKGWKPTPLEAGEFVCIPDSQFEWSVSYTADDYLGLMKIRSPVNLELSAEQRTQLLFAISEAITTQGRLVVNYISHLCLASAPPV